MAVQTGTVATSRLVDRLTARALAVGLRTHVDVQSGAHTLTLLAAGNHAALRFALARVERGNLERSSPVGARAATALRIALAT